MAIKEVKETNCSRIYLDESRKATKQVTQTKNSLRALNGAQLQDDWHSITPEFRKKGFIVPYKFYSAFSGKLGKTHYRFRECNDGHLVLTFHGFNGCHSTFQEIQEKLYEAGYSVLSFDLFGFGLSSAPKLKLCTKRYSLDFYVNQANELLQYLKLDSEKITLLGFSMGSCIASAYQKKYVDKVSRLILVAPAGLIFKKPHIVKLVTCCGPCVSCAVDSKPIRTISEKKLLHDSPPPDASVFHKVMWNRIVFQTCVKKNAIGALVGCSLRIPMWNAKSLYKKVGKLNTPTLIMWGSEDNICPIKNASRMQKYFLNSFLLMFNGATHLLISEMSEFCIKAIQLFLCVDPKEPCNTWVFPFNSLSKEINGFNSIDQNTISTATYCLASKTSTKVDDVSSTNNLDIFHDFYDGIAKDQIEIQQSTEDLKKLTNLDIDVLPEIVPSNHYKKHLSFSVQPTRICVYEDDKEPTTIFDTVASKKTLPTSFIEPIGFSMCEGIDTDTP